MKDYDTKDINRVDRPQVPRESRTIAATVARPAADHVTLEAPRDAEAHSSARQRTSASRATRLKELETALKGGAYRPDVGQLAEKLLSAAEVDARLRAMMRG